MHVYGVLFQKYDPKLALVIANSFGEGVAFIAFGKSALHMYISRSLRLFKIRVKFSGLLKPEKPMGMWVKFSLDT